MEKIEYYSEDCEIFEEDFNTGRANDMWQAFYYAKFFGGVDKLLGGK